LKLQGVIGIKKEKESKKTTKPEITLSLCNFASKDAHARCCVQRDGTIRT
jgi:hypothetical protein